jgi:multidrug efflux pump subunit AcrB
VDAINQVKRNLNVANTLFTTFQGNAQAFQDSLTTQPMLILAAIIAVYIILGMLYESLIHPITILSTIPSAGVGALLILMAFHLELSLKVGDGNNRKGGISWGCLTTPLLH